MAPSEMSSFSTASARLLANLLSEFLHVLWSVWVRSTQLLVQKEWLEYGIRRETEDGEESVSNDQGEDSDQDHWGDWGGHFEVSGAGKEDVGTSGIKTSDANNTEEVQDGTDAGSPSESASICNDQGEGVQSSRAEVGVGKGDLDVCVLRDVLDALLKDVEAVSSQADQSFDALVFSCSLGHGLSVPFEKETDGLDDSNTESSEGNWSHVVPETPSEGSSDGSLSLSISGDSEVPDASRASNDKLAHTVHECRHPEETEDLVVESVSCLLTPFDVG